MASTHPQPDNSAGEVSGNVLFHVCNLALLYTVMLTYSHPYHRQHLTRMSLHVTHNYVFSSRLSVNLIVLVIYDYALTLNREIDYVWPSKWNLIKATFLVQRYLPFLDLILFRIICTLHSSAFSVSALLFSLKRSI
jgi:hypothetical protein